MDIKEIAEQVSKRIYVEDGLLLSKFISEKFAEALIESYKAELLKEAGEPVLYAEFAEDGGWLGDASEYADHLEEPHALFTSDQLAAAIAKATKLLEDQLAAAREANEHWQRATAENENKWIEANDKLAKAEQLWQIAQGRCDGLEEKLAKAEQRVAEACALQVATETKFHWLDAARVAKEIRSGEWRKFVKEA